MPRYGVTIHTHGQYAKTKGIIGAGRDHIFSAKNHEEAYEILFKLYGPNDKRRLAGKSYLYKCVLKAPKVGDVVKVLKGYKVGYNHDGSERRAYYGKVSEVITDNAVSLEFPGYHTKYVDFGLSEIFPAHEYNYKQEERNAAEWKHRDETGVSSTFTTPLH